MPFKKGRRPRAELWNPNTIERFHKEKRGREEDHGAQYKPWLTVQDVPSTGISSRICSWKSGCRDVHLLSKLELYYFYTCLWDDDLIDFREQFPLAQEKTIALAKAMNIVHPCAGPDESPIVMTTDVRLTRKNADGTHEDLCRSIKPAGTFTFVFDDLVCLERFVAKLRGEVQSHYLSRWLLDSMSTQARDRVKAYKGGTDLRLHQTIIRELNRIIKGPLIFDQSLFAPISIAEETWSLVKKNPVEDKLVLVNRLLLRDAFPSDLTDAGPFDRLTYRDKEKMKIERTYWNDDEKAWELVTEADIDMILARNVEGLHPYYFLEPYGVTEELKKKMASYLEGPIRRKERLSDVASAADKHFGLTETTSLTIARHLIVRKEWKIDLSLPFEPYTSLNFLN